MPQRPRRSLIDAISLLSSRKEAIADELRVDNVVAHTSI